MHPGTGLEEGAILVPATTNHEATLGNSCMWLKLATRSHFPAALVQLSSATSEGGHCLVTVSLQEMAADK